MLRTNEALEKMMLRTDEALEKIREVLDRYSLSYHIQDLLTESFKLELTPSGIIVYFNESNQTWGMIDGDSGFNFLTLDGITNAIYRALSEEINPVTDEFKAIIDAIVSDLHSMLHIPLRVDKYNPGHITYLNSDMDDDYSFMVYKSEQSPDVYVLDILDVGFGESAVTIEYKAVDGKPVRLLDYTSYMAIVQTFFDDFVEVYCIRKDTGVFRFTFVDDYADLVDVIAQVNFETGVYTLIGVGFTPVRKEVNLQRGMFDFETLYKYCASLDRSSTGQSTQQEFDEFKEDTLPASFDLQVITFQGKPLGIHVVGDNYIYSISLEKANQLGLPVYRLTNTIEVTSHRGMLLSPTEIERKTFAVDITGDEDLCKSIIDAFWG